MNRFELISEIKKKKSFLCIGLDIDIEKIPDNFKSYEYPIFEFNKNIIDTTHDLCVAYKPNTAFYESCGSQGWISLERTAKYIHEKGNLFSIADAKRGDISNTSRMYAKTFFENMDFDAITVNPYMGHDSITPFLDIKNKWTILLSLTSNPGSKDFQLQKIEDKYLYESILHTTQKWGTKDNIMFVVGATHPEMLVNIRKIVPEHFLLVPGVGSQGGNLSEISKFGMNTDCGILVNVSRNIIYAHEPRIEAQKIQTEMSSILDQWFNS